MKVGDHLTISPIIEGARCKPIPAVVIYIHPKRRYYTVECAGTNGMKFRESFPFQYRRGNCEG